MDEVKQYFQIEHSFGPISCAVHNIGANIGNTSLLDTTSRVYTKVQRKIRNNKSHCFSFLITLYIEMSSKCVKIIRTIFIILLFSHFMTNLIDAGVGDGSIVIIFAVSWGW